MSSRIKMEEDAPAITTSRYSGMELDQDDDSSAEEEKDELVRVIDVFLSPELSQQLYLLQYPGQHEGSGSADATAAPNNNNTPVSARIKPRHGMIEAEHSVQAVHNRATRTYQSQTIPVTTHLCLGKLVSAVSSSSADNYESGDTASSVSNKDNTALHLVPLTHITQMRPSFQHLAEDAYNNDADEEENAENKNDDAKNKPIGFQRKESDRAAAARKSSFAFKKASQEAEAWIDLTVVSSAVTGNKKKNFFDDDDDDANQKRQAVLEKVVCPDQHQSILEATATAAAAAHEDEVRAFSFVQTLNYLPVTTADGGLSQQMHYYNGSESDMKSIVATLTSLLQWGGPIPFSILRSQFIIGNNIAADSNSNDTDAILLSVLNVCAVLIRGNWCLHSKFFLVATSDRSQQQLLQRVRTFLLLLLQDRGVIHRSRLERVCSATGGPHAVTPDRLLSLLKLVAKKQPAFAAAAATITSAVYGGWNLKIADDVAFLERHPDVCSLHESYWDRQRVRFARELKVYDNDRD